MSTPDMSGAHFALPEKVSFSFRFLGFVNAKLPVITISRNFNACLLLLCEIFHFKERSRKLKRRVKPVGEHESTVKCFVSFESLCK